MYEPIASCCHTGSGPADASYELQTAVGLAPARLASGQRKAALADGFPSVLCDSSDALVVIQEAGDLVAWGHFLQGGLALKALVHALPAAVIEVAAGTDLVR